MLYPAQAANPMRAQPYVARGVSSRSPTWVFLASLNASSTNMELSHEPWEVFNLAASIRTYRRGPSI